MKRYQIATLCVAAILSIPSIASANPLAAQGQRQNKRIYHGASNGSLTYREYNHLDNRLDSIRDQYRQDKQDGGGLTGREALKTQSRLTRNSIRIYHQKHD